MITRFSRYIDKGFDFSASLGTLRDTRDKPQIPTSAVWASALFMFVMRQGSLNAIESQLGVPQRLEPVVGKHKPSADTIARVMEKIVSGPLRQILRDNNHRLRRKKALEENRWALRCVAVDGHEFFSQ